MVEAGSVAQVYEYGAGDSSVIEVYRPLIISHAHSHPSAVTYNHFHYRLSALVTSYLQLPRDTLRLYLHSGRRLGPAWSLVPALKLSLAPAGLQFPAHCTPARTLPVKIIQ